MKRYQYVTCCVNAKAEDIDAMVDNAQDVSYETLKRHCEGLAEWEKEMGYGRQCGLYLKDDWAVGFCKSTYRGQPCYYVRHSAIEYIWVKTA